jgi:phage FluMu protein Com
MPLPILESPKYILTIPSTGKSVEYRPFLVKEEKILLLAQEAENEKAITNAIKDIIKACTFNIVDPDDLTSFDLEYIFLKLRAKSVGEVSEVRCKCEKCETLNNVSINIDEIEISWPTEKQDKTIMLTDKIGITLNYIKVKDIKSGDETKSQTETIIDTIIAMIDNVFDQNGIYKKEDSTHEELVTFINSLNRSQMEKIEKFIINSPKLTHIAKFKCSDCKHVNELILSGTQAFFE